MTKRTTSKAGRMVILRDLRSIGLLAGMTLREIAPRLGVTYATISRDMHELDRIEAESKRLVLEWNEPIAYHDGVIRSTSDGKFSAAYMCRRMHDPYQAAAGYFETVDDAKAAIDQANGAQSEYLSYVDAVSYEQVRKLSIGARWYKPKFWGPAKNVVLRVVHIAPSFILSTDGSIVYLSMGNADCQRAFVFGTNADIYTQVAAWVKQFNTPIETPTTCHYCGQPATEFNLFDVLACNECS